jgi:hypothetical protein
MSLCHSGLSASSVPGSSDGAHRSFPSLLQMRTRSSVSSGRRSSPPSSGSTRPISSPEPTAMAITGADRQLITQLLHKAGIAVQPGGTGRQTAGDEQLDQLMAGMYQEHRYGR